MIEGEESTSKKGSVTTAAEQSDSNIEEAIHKLSKVLLKQQMGLNYLNDILEKILKLLIRYLKSKLVSFKPILKKVLINIYVYYVLIISIYLLIYLDWL